MSSPVPPPVPPPVPAPRWSPETLARAGVQRDWVDADDRPHRVPEATIEAVLAVVGEPPADLADRAPVVTRPGRRTGLAGEVLLEDGGTARLDDLVPDDFPLGYHRLRVDGGAERRLVVSPGRCWLPPERTWGWAVQLYAALSTTSAGIGDLGDLRTLREWTERRGGGFVVVNPLHAVAPVLPLEASPYLPATRRFRNPVYLRVEGSPDGGGDRPSPATVDRDAAWEHKMRVLRTTFADRGEEPAFDAWRAEQGAALEEFATWMVLATEHGGDWRAWPAGLHDPHGEEVRRAAAERRDDVTFHAWLQWLLSEQLREASGDLMVIQDLPIGVSGGGADAWAWQDVLARGLTVGAPPDALNSVGQDWGSPPLVPWRLRAADYEPFVQSVRATIAGAGGLRIDHVMGLFRLWCIPEGASPTEGCYVRFPADDLLDIVCLESHRARAVVVGEDLGTVEPGVAEALAERDVLTYRVLWFEPDDPATWPVGSMATVTTHDLPTVPGLWTGSDVEDQLASSTMAEDDVRAGRQELLQQLLRDGLSEEATATEAVVEAYTQLGRAPSLLVSLSLEDALGEERRPNVPGTTAPARANWSIPLPTPVDRLDDAPGPATLVALVDGRPDPA
ncbi:4-alpha-glucanotransferase [Nocardioides dongxiaopingii]|uniref:4-alpha-glucanotransferase n=1 Tax=Nocardioides sp. S-1144 TaxID=2582905 RepID=UPI00116495C9|nr:4-alpha-glucanotransferase [Nocardioides sp. S-1144]QDH11071.1 4-alpha-glucanotransferase [Nocardioides sp. S-1144]